jgi:hypothetical protein
MKDRNYSGVPKDQIGGFSPQGSVGGPVKGLLLKAHYLEGVADCALGHRCCKTKVGAKGGVTCSTINELSKRKVVCLMPDVDQGCRILEGHRAVQARRRGF